MVKRLGNFLLKVINAKEFFLYICIFLFLLTRFVGLNWGLPYVFHPDERNIANALQEINLNNLDPHFYAYGQFSIYLGYVLALFIKFLNQTINLPISFYEATIALRSLAIIANILTLYFLLKIILQTLYNDKNLQNKNEKNILFIASLIFILSPYSIQFSHFGTTESLLIFFYTAIIFYSIKATYKIESFKNYFVLGVLSGCAIATKISSIIFLGLPILVILNNFLFRKIKLKKKIYLILKSLGILVFIAFIFALIGSPFNIISWKEFLTSIGYEREVGLGIVKVFYTRQFEDTIPVIFQLLSVFPYSLGFWQFILFIIGFVLLPWKKEINWLRIAFLLYFIPNSFFYVKWTRFMAPIYPICTIFVALFLYKLPKILKLILCVIVIISGILFLKVYFLTDTRVSASLWMKQNIKSGAVVLSEGFNPYVLPLEGSYVFKIINFDFYNLDSSKLLQQELVQYLRQADYIIVPSRRVFANHKAEKYPKVSRYYADLFSENLGFKQVAKFDLGLNDEMAEETFSVFDHPIIRIFKKIK